MNNKNILGIALVIVAALAVGFISSSTGEVVSRFVGKAVWYLPYVALVGAVRLFRAN